MIFWGFSGPPPGRRQERFEAPPAATLGPHGAQKLPGTLRSLILDPPPPPPLEHFSFIFCDFRPAFLKRSRFLGLFFFACVFVLALCFGGFDALILQV